MEKKKRLIVDIDNTVTVTENGDYVHSKAVQATIDMLKKYKAAGFEIVMFSSRNMRTYEANVGKINIHTLPNIINCFFASNIQGMNSLNKLKGGFVTIISDSSLSFITSSDLKSPSPSKYFQ